MWFDSHCHLHLCDGSPAEVIERARAARVDEMLAVGIDIASSLVAADLAGQERVWAACGVHPNECSGFGDSEAEILDELLGRDGVVAVGESGLDFYRDDVDPETQRRTFGVHIDLAKLHDKTLVIHTRDSVGQAIDVLESVEPPARLVFHCWSGGPKDLARALRLGAFISFAGNISFRSAASLREVAALVPEDRLLVETDSPFLSPEPHRGRPNEPAHVADVGRAVAEAKKTDIEVLASDTTRNARRLFGLT